MRNQNISACRLSGLRGFAVCAALLTGVAGAAAQSLTYTSGQNVAPAYEGWEEDADAIHRRMLDRVTAELAGPAREAR